MKPSTLFTAFAGSFFVLVLLRDGTIPRLVNDAAKGTIDFANGIKPITKVG